MQTLVLSFNHCKILFQTEFLGAFVILVLNIQMYLIDLIEKSANF